MTFFSDTTGAEFRVFGPLHIAQLTFVLLGIVLIYVFRDRLRRFGHEVLIRWLFAGILFTNMTVYYGSKIIMGTYSWRKHLPFEFCFITGYIFMYILLSQNQKLWRVIWFFTIVGPLPAMLWPNLSGSYDRFIFWQFFICHHVMVVMSVYCLVVFRWRVRIRDMWLALVWGVLMFSGIYTFNLIFGTNYLMQNELPETVVSIFPFLLKFDVPVFWLLLCGLAGLLLAGGLAYLLQYEPNEQEFENANIINSDNEQFEEPITMAK